MIPVNHYTPSNATALQTDMSATIAVPRSKEQYYALWSAWEKEALPGGGELRAIAVLRMRDCLERKSDCLSLNRLHLHSLPVALPEHILELNASDNNLSILPDDLPKNLQILVAINNQLVTLPDTLPEGLSEMILCDNKIEKIPDHLPSSLLYLDLTSNKIKNIVSPFPDSLINLILSNNKLSSIPERLPRSLVWLDLSNNKLETLSAGVMNASQNTEIDLLNNPLSQPTIAELDYICHPRHCAIPRKIYY